MHVLWIDLQAGRLLLMWVMIFPCAPPMILVFDRSLSVPHEPLVVSEWVSLWGLCMYVWHVMMAFGYM
jgi:hypothetical protein